VPGGSLAEAPETPIFYTLFYRPLLSHFGCGMTTPILRSFVSVWLFLQANCFAAWMHVFDQSTSIVKAFDHGGRALVLKDNQYQFWTHDAGFFPLPFTGAVPATASRDFSVMAGNVVAQDGHSRPFVWTQTTGAQPLFDPQSVGYTDAYLTDVSDSGGVFIGSVRRASSPGVATAEESRAFRWSAVRGLELLPNASNDNIATTASIISGDGIMTFGIADRHEIIDGQIELHRDMVRWDATGEPRVVQPGISNTVDKFWSGSTYDGQVAVGKGALGFIFVDPQPVRHHNALDLMGISEDGRIIATEHGWMTNDERNLGSVHRYLFNTLVEHGIPMQGDIRDLHIMSLSANGRVFTGWTELPEAPWRVEWVAEVPEPSTTVMLSLGAALLATRYRLSERSLQHYSARRLCFSSPSRPSPHSIAPGPKPSGASSPTGRRCPGSGGRYSL
jgi:hypothetical protein